MSESEEALAQTRAPIDFPATKIGPTGIWRRTNRTAPRRSSSSADRSRDAGRFASTYRKLKRRASHPSSHAAVAARFTKGFLMSFERPCAITRASLAAVEGVWTIPRTSPLPLAVGKRTSESTANCSTSEESHALLAADRRAPLVQDVQVLEDGALPDQNCVPPVRPPDPLRKVLGFPFGRGRAGDVGVRRGDRRQRAAGPASSGGLYIHRAVRLPAQPARLHIRRADHAAADRARVDVVGAVRLPSDLVLERVVRARLADARLALREDLARACAADDVIAERARAVARVACDVAPA